VGRGTLVALPYVQPIRNRHGKLYYYFRREGRRIPLPGKPGSPAFMMAYNAALASFTINQVSDRSPVGSVSAAIAEYYGDNTFLSLAPATRTTRRAILERFRAEDGEKRLSKMEQRHIAKRLGRMRPFAARNWLKTLRGLMAFAVATGLRHDDPTDGIKPVKAKAGTIHTWTEDEIAQFERAHPVGSRSRLAMALLLYTAARRGDAILLGPQHIRAGRLSYRQQKTGRLLAIPVHPALAEILAASPSGHLTFLVTAHGKPFSAAGVGNWFRDCCNEAGLQHCSAHGLRKAQARRLAEAGCSAHEIAAITGHKTLSEVQRHTEAAEQARMAESAFGRTRGEP
jgi:integrase